MSRPRPPWPGRLPVSGQSPTCELGLSGELLVGLAPPGADAHALAIAAALSALGPGGELERAVLLGQRRRAPERILLALGQQLPGEPHELARHRDRDDVRPAPGAVRCHKARNGRAASIPR